LDSEILGILGAGSRRQKDNCRQGGQRAYLELIH
jgi:hypothetical protein